MERIQRKRIKGWRMPSGAVYVGRRSKWGNPFTIGIDGSRDEVIALYRQYIEHGNGQHLLSHLHELQGKDLACWCKLDDPCHADVLIDLVKHEVSMSQ